MAKITAVTTGDRKINRALARLAGPDKKKPITKAARPAIKPIMQQSRQNANESKDSGDMGRSVKVRAIPRSRSRIGARVTTSADSLKGGRFYAAFQNYGWKAGKVKRQVAGSEFMNRAAETKKAMALRLYHENIWKIIKELAKG